MRITAAMKVSNCGGLLALLLRLHFSLIPECTPKRVQFRLKFFMKIHKFQFEQKYECCCFVIVFVIVVITGTKS